MKGQVPVPVVRRCDRCNKEIPEEMWLRNVRYGRHYCDDCYSEILRRMVGMPPMRIDCPICGEPVDYRTSKNCHNCGYKITPMKCPHCNRWMDKNAKSCSHCGWTNPNYVKPRAKSLQTISAKKINLGKVYEILVYEAGGIFTIFGLPFFGLPSFPFLGAVLMILIPFYSFLPSQGQVLSSRAKGVESIGFWGAGALTTKGVVKLFSFILTVWQFLIVPVSRLIPLAISFLYYFTLPTTYKTSQPSKMINAWFRLVVGGFIAWFLYMAFAGTPQAFSLTLMAIAFFCTSLPKHKEEEKTGVVKINIFNKYGKLKKHPVFETGLSVLFFMFMLVAFQASGVGIGFSEMQVIFILVWILSLITGLASGSAGRPAVGVLMIGITLFVFTFTATGVMGRAVFGYWWPMVENFGNTYFGPLGDMWTHAQRGMSDTWLLLIDPQSYYLKKQQEQMARKSVVKTGGTIKSIEILEFNILPSIVGILEPSEPTIGIIELKNEGEFESDFIDLTLLSVWRNPDKLKEFPVGRISDLKCSDTDENYPGTPAYCNWTDTTYPGQVHAVTFKLDEGTAWDNADVSLYSGCIDETDNSPCNCFGGGCTPGNTTYNHSGETVKVYANLTYGYNVNVSIPVTIINTSLYIEKIEADEMVLQDITSEYTGGPVKATLWTPKQPVRTGEPSLVVASIYNEGNGDLLEVEDFEITVYGDYIDSVEVIASTFRDSGGGEGCDTDIIGRTGNDFIFGCVHRWSSVIIEPEEYRRVSFYITPKAGLTEEKTTQIVAWAKYKYKESTSQNLMMANAPPQ